MEKYRDQNEQNNEIPFTFCLDTYNYVVQANELVSGKQALKLNSAKLIRCAIMQIVMEDEELKPYIITISDLSKLLNVPSSNIYRDIKEITDDIIKNPVYVRDMKDGKTVRFIKIPWVTKCEYVSDVGVYLKLNRELKPFLLKLKEHYTQYTLQDVLSMKSVYGIRIYELLLSKIMSRTMHREGVKIVISIQEIRECCGCEDKYRNFADLRVKVIDKAIKEINRGTIFWVEYSYIKRGKSVIAIEFFVNLRYFR